MAEILIKHWCLYKKHTKHSRHILGVHGNIITAVILSFETLKGLGHAILGNFSTDQIVIELT